MPLIDTLAEDAKIVFDEHPGLRKLILEAATRYGSERKFHQQQAAVNSETVRKHLRVVLSDVERLRLSLDRLESADDEYSYRLQANVSAQTLAWPDKVLEEMEFEFTHRLGQPLAPPGRPRDSARNGLIWEVGEALALSRVRVTKTRNGQAAAVLRYVLREVTGKAPGEDAIMDALTNVVEAGRGAGRDIPEELADDGKTPP